jgi:hypothetical protein
MQICNFVLFQNSKTVKFRNPIQKFVLFIIASVYDKTLKKIQNILKKLTFFLLIEHKKKMNFFSLYIVQF